MKSIERPSSRWSSRTRLSTAPWIETSSAEVISSAMRTWGRPARARASATRCRWPPESCGRAGRGARRVEVDQLEQPRDLGAARCALGPGPAASPRRWSRRSVIRGSSEEYGSWKTICSGRAGRVVGTGCAVEQDAAAGERREPDRGAGEGGLARARLPDQPDDLPGGHGQAHAVDGGTPCVGCRSGP